MKENYKNILLVVLYSYVTYLLFWDLLEEVVQFVGGLIFPQYQHVNILLTQKIPSIIVFSIKMAFLFLIIFAILRFIKLSRLNNFYKPNKFKLFATIITLTSIYVINSTLLRYFWDIGYYVSRVLFLYIPGFHEIGIFFPVFIYYSLFCWIDYLRNKKRVSIE